MYLKIVCLESIFILKTSSVLNYIWTGLIVNHQKAVLHAFEWHFTGLELSPEGMADALYNVTN
jgi:hypothetical protein